MMNQAIASDPGRGVKTRHILFALTCAALIGLCLIFVLVSLQARREVGREVSVSAANLAAAVAHDVDRNVELLDLSLQAVVGSWSDPDVLSLNSVLRQKVLFDHSLNARYSGTMLVLDEQGIVRASSKDTNPRPDDFGDRDYFRVHQGSADFGLFVSKPFISRLSGKWTVAFSRRINRPDGSFGGVALATLWLAYLDELYAGLDLGDRGTITLFRTDGTVVTRKPYVEGDINRSLRSSDGFNRIRYARVGSFEGVSPIDGQTRLISFHRVGDLPLIQVVEIAADEAYAQWWRKTLVTGAVLGLLCLSSLSLLLLFNAELARRIVIEAALARLAGTDGLTEVANRRRFDERLTQAWKSACDDGSQLSLLMLDADRFKAYNDTFGHLRGDDLLRSIADAITGHVHRPGDLVARYGGEEFAVLLPRTDEAGAFAVAEAIRETVVKLGHAHPGSPTGLATVSVGVASMRPGPGEASHEIIARADASLYLAKAAGRNCSRQSRQTLLSAA